MSVKFESETIRRGVEDATRGLTDGEPIPGTSGRRPVAAAIGTALTGGKEAAGTKGYLAVRSSLFSFPPSPW